jgi:hypothetical protein
MALQTASAKAAARLQPLPKPYDTPPAAEALRPGPATIELVRSQVDALLTASPSYHALDRRDQQRLRSNLVKIASYSAELIRDDWYQSRRLGQTPMLRRKEVVEGPLASEGAAANGLASAQAAADDFRPAAANQIGRVTRETLNAVAFPTFVADLIHGTFNAITQSSVQQIEAYVRLLDNVSKTVDQFMNSSVSDAQAHAWLAEMYPTHIRLEDGRAVPQSNADERPLPDFQKDLNVDGGITLDESSIEETLVPAARRKLAQSRLQSLSTMVLMGMNRIIITGGKLRATMGFHIDTRDQAQTQTATDLDLRHSGQFQIGYGWIGGSASHSIAYVSSTRTNSDAEINVQTDLTGEVELLFKTESFPIRRFADGGTLNQIRSNTPNPDENPVNDGKSSNPFGEITPSSGSESKYPSFKSPLTKDRPPKEEAQPIRKLGELPQAPKPPDEVARVKDDLLSEKYKFSPDAAEKAKSDKSKDNAEAKKDGESGQPEAGGEDTQAGGESKGAGGEDTQAGGGSKGAGGEDTQAGGESKDAGGEKKEAGSENKGAGGEKKNEAPARKGRPDAKGKK